MDKVYSEFWLKFCYGIIELDKEFQERDDFYLAPYEIEKIEYSGPHADIYGNPINSERV